jgi:hypothetical protein
MFVRIIYKIETTSGMQAASWDNEFYFEERTPKKKSAQENKKVLTE